jgi:Protein of unknown function (DUF2442)
MSIAANVEARIQSVSVTDDKFLPSYRTAGRLAFRWHWSWRLSEATPGQRARFEIIGNGSGIHCLEIDEDISVDGMLHGGPARTPAGYDPFFIT